MEAAKLLDNQATEPSKLSSNSRNNDVSVTLFNQPEAQTTPILSVKNLCKDFSGHLAVDNLSIDIQQGEIFALLGGSGCGKSTLLRMLAGFEKPTSGQILLNGEDLADIPPHKRAINMMFQSYALFPHMTVEKNIAFGLTQDRVPKKEIKARVDEMLELVHLTQYAKRKPHQLSGGQRQRVALARSLAKRPKLLLLDEPMGALDKSLREKMQLEVVDILDKVGATCVMVTHDQEEAMTMASRIAIMNQGHFVQIGEPSQIYEYPNSRFSAEFIGSVNIFEGTVGMNRSDSSIINCPALPFPIHLKHGVSNAVGQSLMIALRPEKISISLPKEGQANSCVGVIKDIAYMGSQSIFHVQLPSGQVVIVTRPNQQHVDQSELHYKQQVSLSWSAESNRVVKL
ncbi:polyamine ABC transporter ATP-binding protein [Vibrio sp.]|uniref:polyamine ABC transporter ATP-binding protein n=1 Tax=Vibrio sp. TaxID=678 RepID=UPI003D0FC63F